MDGGRIFRDPADAYAVLRAIDDQSALVGAARGRGPDVKITARLVGPEALVAAQGPEWATDHVRDTCKVPAADAGVEVLGACVGDRAAAEAHRRRSRPPARRRGAIAAAVAISLPHADVVIVGAGPAGILLAINLLGHNEEGKTPAYTVELVESGEDYGLLDADGLTKKRSCMIGLAWPGIRAIRRAPGLWEKHVSHVGVPISKLAMHLGSKKFVSSSGAEGTDSENYLVDRN